MSNEPPIKRLKYFPGQFLEAADFTAEQTYHLDMRRRGNSAFYSGAGILDGGFHVSIKSPTEIGVSPGIGVNGEGQELILLDELKVTAPVLALPAPPSGFQTYRVALAYDEQEGVQQIADQDVSDNTRYLEHPKVEFFADGAAINSADWVVVGSIEVRAVGGVSIGAQDADVRAHASAHVPGNFGIGTAAPSAKLEVAGHVTITSPSSQFSGLQFNRRDESDRAHIWALWHMNAQYRKNALELWEYKTDSTGKNCGGDPQDGAMCNPRLVILEGGSVGIGTTSPASLLHVAGNTHVDGTLVVGPPVAAGSPSVVLSGPNAPTGLANQQSLSFAFAAAGSARLRAYRGTSWGTTLEFLTNANSTGSDSPQVRLQIIENGFVGVGTVPAAQLHVGGTGGQSIDLLVNGRLKSDNSDGGLWVSTDRFVGGFDTNKLGLQTGNAWRLTVAADGSIGIGTTDPKSLLHLLGGSLAITEDQALPRADAKIHVVGGGGRLTQLSSKGASKYALNLVGSTNAASAEQWWAWGVTSANTWRIRNSTDFSGEDGLSIDSLGQVGIATSSPQAKLHVNGAGGGSVDLLVNGRLRSDNNDGGLWIASNRFVGGLDTDKLGFYSGNAWRLTVAADGNVGIGTTDPKSRLHVVGNESVVNLEGTSQAYLQWYPKGLANGRKGWIGYSDSNSSAFTMQNDGGRMHISGAETLYLLNMNGVHVSNAWGGSGNLTVDNEFQWGGDQSAAGHIRIGSLRICWGRASLQLKVNTGPTSAEVSSTVNFPAAFGGVPVVTVSIDDPGFGKFFANTVVGALNVSASDFTAVAKRIDLAGNSNWVASQAIINWIAIGVAA